MKVSLALVLLAAGGTARAATLSGEVICDACDAVTVRLLWGPTPVGPPLAAVTLDAPGAWSITVADGVGLVGAYAYEDADYDGEPDPGAVVAAYAANPIDVGSQDLAGIDLVATPALPSTVSVSGTIVCDGCALARVRLAPGPSPAFPFAELELGGEGPWSVDVPIGLGAVWVYGAAAPFVADHAWVAWPGNPIAIADSDVPGIDLELAAPDTEVVLSGTILCASCAAGVGIEVRLGDALGPIVLAQALAAPGAFALGLPVDLGPVALVAFRDEDGDGLADPGAAVGAYAQNPVNVEQDDILGIALVVPASDGGAVEVSGTVACDDCVGVGVVVRLGDALGPDVVAATVPAGAGPTAWSMRLPRELGAVGLVAFRDDDGDGLPDPGEPVGLYDQNPLTIGDADVPGIALSVPPRAATTVSVSGSVTCPDCTGGVGVRVHLGVTDGPLFATVARGEPGAFVVELPTGLGEVALVAFRDDDLDGLPDAGGLEAEYAENPLEIGASDVTDVAIDLPAGGAAFVLVAGRVDCDDCPAGVGVVAIDDDGPDAGTTLVRLGLPEPAGFTFAVPRDTGPIALFAYRDDDVDFVPDEGAMLVAYTGNPVVIGSALATGIVIDLTPEAQPDAGPEAETVERVEEIDAGGGPDADATAAGDADAIEDVDPGDATDVAPHDADDADASTEADVPDDAVADAVEDADTHEHVDVSPDADTSDVADTGDVADTRDVADTSDVISPTDAGDVGPDPDPTDAGDAGADVALEADTSRAGDEGCGCSGGAGDPTLAMLVLVFLSWRRRVDRG